jgi:cytochrome c
MIMKIIREISVMGFAFGGFVFFLFAPIMFVSAPALAADAPSGEDLYLACSACHSASEDALGPNLENVIGREAALRDDFRYSPAMQRSGIVWTEANLREFLLDPQGFVRGNRMPFSGFSEPAEADAVIAYLKELE